MDPLGKLFGSMARVKIMRLFLLNPEDTFEAADVAKRSKVPAPTVRKELTLLASVGLVAKRTTTKMKPIKKGKKVIFEKRQVVVFELSVKFPHIAALRMLLTDISSLDKKNITSRFKGVGHVKLIIVAGIFLDEDNSRADIMIVGERLKRPAIETALKKMEAEIGKELSYAIFETPDFLYRYEIYDKFVRDMLDYPHLVVLNKLDVF